MGADFLYAALEWPKVANGDNAKNSDILAGAVVARLATIVANTESINELGFFGNWDEELADEWRNDCVESAREVVSDLFGAGAEWARRDIAYFDPDWDQGPTRRYWVITGGMSWGDVPTDAYDTIALLDALGVTNEPFDIENPVEAK